MCKLCSTSVLQLSDEMLISIFGYCLNSLDTNKENTSNQNKITVNELQTILKLAETIFKNFTRTGLLFAQITDKLKSD